jgi:outer membrane protein assembly factor BamD
MLYIRFLKILCFILALTSCAARSTSVNYLSKYQQAVARYQAKDYYEALRLFKEVMPMLKGKKEIIPAQFYQAYAFFYEKSYKVSARCFEEFYKTYPRVPQAEEALYMQGYALYLNTPDVRLDQTETQKAFSILRLYVDKYPEGTYQKQADEYSHILQAKLALQAFNSAQLYYQLGHYQAAVLELERFQETYGHSSYDEQAAYLKVNAQYRFAEASKPKKRLAKKQLDREQLPKEQLPKEQLPKEQLPKEQLPKEQLPKEQLPKEQLPKEQLPKEQLPKEQLPKEQLPKEQLDKLLVVINYYHEFLDKYPTSKYAKELEKLYHIVLEKINTFVS